MNADKLLKHYEKIADEPDAVRQLRSFILDLAVRGKLVLQDSMDKPATDLLIYTERASTQLVSSGSLRGKAAPRPITADVMPFKLPATWRWVRFANIADFSAGRTPSRNDTSFWNTGDYAWVSIADMRDGQILMSTKETVSDAAKRGVFGTEPEIPGTIIMSFKLTIGKISRLGISAFHNEAIISIRPYLEDLDPYLFMVLPQFAKLGDTKGAIKGATLNRESLSNILLPLPPLAEQKRIVAKVGELMDLCDGLEAAHLDREAARDRLAASSLARLSRPDPETFPDDARFVIEAMASLTARPHQINRVREVLLNLAVLGRLVRQDPNDEASSVMFHRLKAAKSEALALDGLRSRTPVSKLERSEMWFTIPQSWTLASFDEIFLIASGVTKGQLVAANDAVDLPYLRVANVQRGYLDLSLVKSITVKNDDKTRYALRSGDVLMTEGGDWDKLGRAAIWRNEISQCIHQNHIFRVRPPSGDIVSEWVAIFVNSLLGRSFFENASKQTTNLASINMTQLRGCPLPLPPLAEQYRIVAKIAELMKICDELESALISEQRIRTRLLDSLIKEAIDSIDDAAAVADPPQL